MTAGSIKNSGSAWRPNGSGGAPKKQSTGAFLPVDAGKVTQYAPGSAESIAAFSRLTPEEKLAAGWQGSNAGGGVSAWQPAPAPFAVPDQTKALADMTARAAQGRKTKDWADYTNRLGTGLQTVTSDETQAFRDEVNKSYDEAINAGQTRADQQFYDENDEMYRNQQEVMALYGNLPEEALQTGAGRDVIENAISAGNKYNELVAGNQARQTKVNNIRAQKTQANDMFKLEDIGREISHAQETPGRFDAIVEAGQKAEDNKYEQAYSDDNLLNNLAQNGTPEQQKMAVMVGGGDLLAGAFIRKEAFMTEGERDIINYYYGIGAPEEADKFYKLLERDLDKRKSDFIAENRAAFMAENDSGIMRAYEAGSNIMSGIAGAFGMVGETIGQKIQNAVTGEYRNVNMYGVSGNLKRNEQITRDALVEGLSPEMAAIVDMGLGIGKTLPMMMAGPAVAPALIGAQTAGNTMYSVGKRGGNVDQMMQAGAISGAVDAAMSAIPAQEFYKLAGSAPESAIAFAKGMLKQAGLEVTEAAVSSYTQTLADMYVMGENSYYEQFRSGLMANGLGEEAATREANMEFFVRQPVMEMAASAAGGAIEGTAAQALAIMTHRFQNSRLKKAQETIWENFVRETNEIIAKERGLNPGELPQTPEGSAYNPGMEYVTPEGARFPAGDVESGTPGMVFEEGGEGNRQMPPGYSLRELVQDNEEWYKTGDNGDIIITDNAYITAKDGGKHNGKYVNALKWKDNQVNKAYNSYEFTFQPAAAFADRPARGKVIRITGKHHARKANFPCGVKRHAMPRICVAYPLRRSEGRTP